MYICIDFKIPLLPVKGFNSARSYRMNSLKSDYIKHPVACR